MPKYESRATRLSNAMDLTTNIDEVNNLREELEQWLDNMPENLQASEVNKSTIAIDFMDL
jgi:hypothetical protein